MSVALDLVGPAGRLEALLDPSERAPARGGAVVAHPHPLRGGTLHNTVVFRTAKALAAAGFDVVRFNFRGVGASAGVHDEGRGEQDDYRAALDALAARGHGRLLAAGYSFGSVMALRAGMDDARVAGCAAIGMPVRIFDTAFVARFAKPLLIVQGSHDTFGSPQEVERVVASLPSAEVVAIPASGHFFEGRAAEVGDAVARFADRVLAAASGS